MRRGVRFIAILWIALVATGAAALTQDVPVAVYTTADGLPQEGVSRILRDRDGFLWIGGAATLTRFDGENFVVFGRDDGLDVGTGINALLVDGGHAMWIATNGAGIYRFDLTTPDPAARFSRFNVGEGRAANRVNALAIGGDGVFWAGTDAGLFAGRPGTRFRRVTLPLSRRQSQEMIQVTALALDASTMWVGTATEAFRCRLADAQCATGPQLSARSLLLGPTGDLWIGGDQGLHVITATLATPMALPRAVATQWKVRSLSASSIGILAGTLEGDVLAVDGDAVRVLPLTAKLATVNEVIEDATQNLWVATQRGLVTARRRGVTLFSTRHGLRGLNLWGVRRDVTGQVYALEENDWLYRIAGHQLTGRRLTLPDGVGRSLWPGTAFLVDHVGDIWLGTARGLYRYPAQAWATRAAGEIKPSRAYFRADGLAGDHISEIFEDSRGDVWIASMGDHAETLALWRRTSGSFERLGVDRGLPAFNQPMAFAEDQRGAVWIGLREGGVARIQNGAATVYGVAEGMPSLVTASLVDARGDVWFGGLDALVRVVPAKDPIRAVPVLSGLNARVLALEEDRPGSLAVGTTSGLLSLDAATTAWRRFSRFDGLPAGPIAALARSHDGSIVMVAGNALARLTPSEATPHDGQIRCMLSAIRAAGTSVPIPSPGLADVSELDIPAAQNAIEIEFLAVSARFGEPLAYQYRLIGLSNEWSTAPQRRVIYAGLAPGRYTFEVRASGSDAAKPSAPARVTFTVLPPWYRRAWFLAASVTAALLAAYAAHRVKLGAAVRTERLRARIATDLHDDIGSSLSQIAILAEVAKRRAGAGDAAVTEPLTSIAATSRDLVEAMSDIVWAVNPQTDSLSDLTHRMRRFAEETLGAADISLAFSGPSDDVDLKMGADLRRELFLIVKESVNNIARHSRATSATIDFSLSGRDLRLVISDDGCGFEPDASFEGHGIASMRKRAMAFGGDLAIQSAPGRGTVVSLSARR